MRRNPTSRGSCLHPRHIGLPRGCLDEAVQAVKRAKAKYVLGLSATVVRKDGHHPIIFMQCGPVRYRVDAKSLAASTGLVRRVKTRTTDFRLPDAMASVARPAIAEIYAAIGSDERRNDLIFDDVLKAMESKR